MPTAELPIADLTRDARLQTRGGIDPATMLRYKERLADGEEFEPVDAVVVGDTRYLTDGHTRTAAAEAAGLKTIKVNWRPGTWEDAVLAAARANAKHGQPRTAEDCRRAMELLASEIPASTGWAVRKFAESAGVSHGSASRFLIDRRGRKTSGPGTRKEPIGEPECTTGTFAEADGTAEEDVQGIGFPDESPDVGLIRQAGVKPSGVVRQYAALPEPDEDTSDPIIEKIRACRVWGMLEGKAKETFEADARAYYEALLLMIPLQEYCLDSPLLKGRRRPDGLFLAALHRLIHHPGPTEWKLCVTCAGAGCNDCQGRGYVWGRRDI
jgi:hypothetical protein